MPQRPYLLTYGNNISTFANSQMNYRTAATLPDSHGIVDAKFKSLTQVCSHLVARVGLEPTAIFDPSEVLLTAIFPRYSITLGASSFGLLKRPQKRPPKPSGCTRITSDVRGRWNPAFLLVFPGLLAFPQVSRTSADVPGSLRKWDGWDSNPGPKP